VAVRALSVRRRIVHRSSTPPQVGGALDAHATEGVGLVGHADDNEAALLRLAESGDRDAMARLVRLWDPLIRARFRAAFEQNRRGIFDSSDFFATMLRRIDAFASSGAKSTLHGDVRDRLHEIMLEALREYADTIGRESGPPPIDPEPGPTTDRNEHDEATRRFLSAVSHLDTTDRAIVNLRARGLTHSAIAWSLGLRVPTVRMRWVRLRQQLRAAAG